MPVSAPVRLTGEGRAALEKRTRSRQVRADDARRARVILMLADGETYESIQQELGCSATYITRWKSRFQKNGLEGLYARHRGRKPTRLTPAVLARIMDVTRRPPDDGSTHWTTRKLARYLRLPHMTVHRAWAQARLKPHRIDRYMASNDPDFERKAADVIGLYLNPPQHAVVFCVDEKSQIQALDRLDPVLPLSPGRLERHGFEYYRHGTLTLFAALDVRTGQVIGQPSDRHTSAEFVAFLENIVASQPKGQDIHIVLDNLQTHKTPSVQAFLRQHPEVRFHFTPTYSSWLNQVEIWFSKIERDVVARGVFKSVDDLARKLIRHIRKYNRMARPIKWTFSDATRRIQPDAIVSSGTVH